MRTLVLNTSASHFSSWRQRLLRGIVAAAMGTGACLGTAWAQTATSPASLGQPAVTALPANSPSTVTSSQQIKTQPLEIREVPNTGGGFSAKPAAAAAGDGKGGGSVPATIEADYKIGPNDLLEVEVFGVSELKRTVRVNSTGQISMPLIGMLQVAGLTPADAEALVAIQYSKNYLQDPQVSIFIKEFTSQRITVDGAVTKPGIYPLTGQITLLRAVAMAGGGGQLADLENVMLFRMLPDGKTLSEKHDVQKIREGQAADPLLQGDDIVVVNRNSTRVTLRDSLFRDILDTINPFSASYRNVAAP